MRRLSVDRRRSEALMLRLTRSELGVVRAAAERAGLAASVLGRLATLAFCDPERDVRVSLNFAEPPAQPDKENSDAA